MRTPTVITSNDIITALRGAIEHRGLDYIYEVDPVTGECQYRGSDGTPSCLFGVAFDALGILPDREEIDVEGQGVANLMLQLEQETDVRFDVSDHEIDTFNTMQTCQDNGYLYRDVLAVLDTLNPVPQGNTEL